MPGPAFLYLHGFASSTHSTKARAFVDWGRRHGVEVQALDLRVPSLEHLRFSAITARVRAAIDAEGPRGRVALIGSSLGGLAASHVAAEEPRVSALFLLAPAFALARQWRAKLGDSAWRRWQETDALEVTDHATGTRTTVDHGFAAELAELTQDEPDVRVPTCIVHGTRDDVVDIAHSRQWTATRPHARLVEVDDDHELGASLPRILTEATSFLGPFGLRG